MDPESPEPADTSGSASARLDSWKEIAAYLNRHVTTVRRWEKSEGLPIHRHLHDKLGSVYAFRAEVDAWWSSRRVRLGQEKEPDDHITVDDENAGRLTASARQADEDARQVHELVEREGAARVRHELRRASPLVCLGGVVLCLGAVVAYIIFPDWAMRQERAAITSIAVLPLENLSGDPTQEYLADGVTEALIGQLAQIRALRVVSRTSSMAVRGTLKKLPEIAKELRVDAVIQGSVQQSGDRVRIRVRLIDGRTDAHLWAHDYEREARDILTLGSEVAQAVGQEIQVRVTPEERARMASTKAVDPAAHQEYVVGRYHLWRDNDEHLQRAIAHFERATAIDPKYAAPYASLAHAWWKRGLWGRDLAATELPTRLAVQKALQLDDALPEAYVVQADLVRLYDRDLVRAEELVARALALQPNNVDAHYTYALVLMTVGRFRDAIMHMEIAEQLDPLSPAIQSDFGRVLYRAGKYDDAILHLNRALELEPAMDWLVHSRLSEVYEQRGQYDRAMSALQQAGAGSHSYQTRRASILARMGKQQEAKRLLEHVEANSGELRPNEIAAAYARWAIPTRRSSICSRESIAMTQVPISLPSIHLLRAFIRIHAGRNWFEG